MEESATEVTKAATAEPAAVTAEPASAVASEPAVESAVLDTSPIDVIAPVDGINEPAVAVVKEPVPDRKTVNYASVASFRNDKDVKKAILDTCTRLGVSPAKPAVGEEIAESSFGNVHSIVDALSTLVPENVTDEDRAGLAVCLWAALRLGDSE